MKQEYRKASAGALGFTQWGDPRLEIYREPLTDEEVVRFHRPWQPDRDHNQMAMIEDKLIKKGYEVRYELHSGEMVATIEKWGMSQTIEHNEYFSESDDSDKRIAFMKAFMEYLKSK